MCQWLTSSKRVAWVPGAATTALMSAPRSRSTAPAPRGGELAWGGPARRSCARRRRRSRVVGADEARHLAVADVEHMDPVGLEHPPRWQRLGAFPAEHRHMIRPGEEFARLEGLDAIERGD